MFGSGTATITLYGQRNGFGSGSALRGLGKQTHQAGPRTQTSPIPHERQTKDYCFSPHYPQYLKAKVSVSLALTSHQDKDGRGGLWIWSQRHFVQFQNGSSSLTHAQDATASSSVSVLKKKKKTKKRECFSFCDVILIASCLESSCLTILAILNYHRWRFGHRLGNHPHLVPDA